MVSRPLESPRLAFVPFFFQICQSPVLLSNSRILGGCCSDVREIGDVDEGVVEGGEDTGNAKDELACWDMVSASASSCDSCVAILAVLTLADLGTEGDVLLRSADGGFLGGHGDGIWTTGVVFSRSLESSTKRRSLKARDAARCGPAELKVRCRLAKTRACLPLSFPPAPGARMESEHRRFSFETLFKAADFRFFSPTCSSHSSSHSDSAPRHALLCILVTAGCLLCMLSVQLKICHHGRRSCGHHRNG
jgi:hypothetical protein